MTENPRTVTITVIEKPACKLIMYRGIKSENYFEYCEEMGCDAWEILGDVTCKLESVAFLELPKKMIKEGTSKTACAVEVPLDYNDEIPVGYDIIEIPKQLVIWLNGAPYENEDWYGYAHQELGRAMENYKPELYGYKYDWEAAPVYHYGTSAEKGCKMMIPVRKI